MKISLLQLQCTEQNPGLDMAQSLMLPPLLLSQRITNLVAYTNTNPFPKHSRGQKSEVSPKGLKSKELPRLLTCGGPRGGLVFWSFPALTDHLRSLAHGPLPPSPKAIAPAPLSIIPVPPSLAFLPHFIRTSMTTLDPGG